ncbi:MAG: nickel pincer cofactor biosynthesis protein LarB [Acidimicrobiia bacterium]
MSVADIDRDRGARTGHPEVVLGSGKSQSDLQLIVEEMLETGIAPLIVTRATAEQAELFPDGHYDPEGKVIVIRALKSARASGRVAVVSGGTSDAPVVSEAATVLRAFGIDPLIIVDAGVAGVHRTLKAAEQMDGIDVVIAVAGMEASLPTVLAGLISAPIIGVPTSVGYGASFDGLAALLSMMASCAPGVTVVNIDNGFGAALAALRIIGRC